MKEKSAAILAEVKQADTILLCCHPSPDPDSVGSNLAMKSVLESMGKKVTLLGGDSEIPLAFMHFPGAESIVKKNFTEVDLKSFDLLIILDAPSLDRVTRLAKTDVLLTMLPPSLKIIMIDHHEPRPLNTAVSLIDTSSPATCALLFDLFKEWGIALDSNIASNLFIGIFTDTGGFKYRNTRVRTFETAAELVKLIPDHSELISRMENTEPPATIAFYGKAFSSVETFLNGHLALSVVSHDDLVSMGIEDVGVRASGVFSRLRVVADWDIVASLIEAEPNEIKCSFRSKDPVNFDVAKLCEQLGGGGHKTAAGAYLSMSLGDAKRLIVSKAKGMYNL